MVDVAADGHFQCAGEGFEDAFYLMVLVLAFGAAVEIRRSGVAE
jgi:hypothetical protein